MPDSFGAVGSLVITVLMLGSGAGGPMALVFQRTYDGGSADALAIGPDGSVYTAGMALGDREIVEGVFDLEVALLRWSPDGDLLWQVRWGGPGDENAEAVAVDAAGAAYVTGSTSSFGTYFEAFLLKFDANGNLVWQRTWGGEREDGGRGIVVGPDGNIYVTGTTQSFGSLFGVAAFLLKLTPEGTILWERTWQAPGGTVVADIAISSDGAIYLVGNTDNSPFLVKFTLGGDLLWDRAFIAPGFIGADTAAFRGIGATPDGGVVAVGRWMPTFDEEVLVVRFSADGAILWTREWGGESHEEAIDAAVSADGTAYVVGRTDTFAQGVYEDIFILKVLSNGRATEARTWGGPNRDREHAVAFGLNGDLYIAGGATSPPFTFSSAPAQMSRVRGATVGDADAIVETPAGTLGTPTGTTKALNGAVGTGDRGGAVLLRIHPG